MVNIFPEKLEDIDYLRPGTQYSEKMVYKALKTLDDNWYVWHSIEWLEKKNLKPRETDFLVFHPEYGFIVLEVKGGEILYFANKWKIQDHQGNIYNMDPIYQAKNAMFFFLKTYVRLAKNEPNNKILLETTWSGERFFPGLFGYALVFPTSNFKTFMKKEKLEIQSINKKMIFDAKDLAYQNKWSKVVKKKGAKKHIKKSPIQRFLEKILILRKNQYFSPLKGKRKEDIKEFFLKLISPLIKTAFLMDKTMYEMLKHLETVNEEQDTYIKLFEDHNWCLFTGSAGTGKTFIAMKKALKLYAQRKKILLLCYNRELKYFIRNTLEEHFGTRIPNDSKTFLVTNIHSFLKEVIESHFTTSETIDLKKMLFGDLDSSASKSQNNKEVAKEISTMIKEGGLKDRFKFDALIIDESQDIDENYWPLLQEFLFDKSRDKSVFYIFYDLQQRIFQKGITSAKFGLEKTECYSLSHNLRNTDNIVDWILNNTHLGKYTQGTKIKGFEVTVLKTTNTLMDALSEAACEIWAYHFDNQLDLDDMVILCDKQLKYIKNSNVLVKNDSNGNQYHYIDFEFTNEGNLFFIEPAKNKFFHEIISERPYPNSILYNGIGTFKGLEKKIVFAVFPNLHNPDFKEKKDFFNYICMNAYIAASRARLKLVVAMYNDL